MSPQIAFSFFISIIGAFVLVFGAIISFFRGIINANGPIENTQESCLERLSLGRGVDNSRTSLINPSFREFTFQS